MQRSIRPEYREHRHRVNLAKSRIDSKPPSSFTQKQSKNTSSNFRGVRSNSSVSCRAPKTASSLTDQLQNAVSQSWDNLNTGQSKYLQKAVARLAASKKKASGSNAEIIARQVELAFKERDANFQLNAIDCENTIEDVQNLEEEEYARPCQVSQNDTTEGEDTKNSESFMRNTDYNISPSDITEFEKEEALAMKSGQPSAKTTGQKTTRKFNPRLERANVKVIKYRESKDAIDHSVPKEIMRYYERLTFYKDFNILQKLLRPKITLHFAAKSKNYARDLGVMTFQLYTEACPGLVLELVRCCKSASGHNRLEIVRIFDPIWVEGELEIEKVSDIQSRLNRIDPKVVPHDSGPGILSFMLQTSKTSVSHKPIICFSISLSPLQVPPGHRIALAMLVSGESVLHEFKKFATRSGKPTDKILVSKCSVVR